MTQIKRKPLSCFHAKYIDDLTLGQAINLKKNLIVNPDQNLVRPLSFHDRTGHILPGNGYVLQEAWRDLNHFVNDRKMKINYAKTKVMLFNSSKNYDFTPQFEGKDGTMLDVVEKMKLLGVVIRSDLRWCDNTKYICEKAYKRLWIIRNLKRLGASSQDLTDVWTKQGRSVLELAVPVWGPALTKNESKQIERVQKCFVAIVLNGSKQSYVSNLTKLGLQTLKSRRQKLLVRFGQKSSKNVKFEKWFCRKTEPEGPKTRSKKMTLKTMRCRTTNFFKSSIPTLLRHANGVN